LTFPAGQTIRKVITLVGDVESELVKLVASFGVKIERGREEEQTVSEIVSQSDVDDLLKDFGF
jgi:chemotaxis protein CheZ